MNFIKNQVDELNLELTVHLDPADYAELEKKKLAAYRKNADFKGFRKGNVPASLILKVYGERILAEAVEETLSQALGKFIEDEKLNVLGEPLTSAKQGELVWKSGESFDFAFDLGLSPKVEVEVSKDDTVPVYTITSTAAEKEEMSKYLKQLHESRKEEVSDEALEKEVAERVSENHKRESEWRLEKDIRDFYVEKSGVKLPEEFLKRWLLHANEGKVTAEQVESEFPGFVADFKWQFVLRALMEKLGLEVTSDDVKTEAENYVRSQYAMYGISDAPAELVENAAKDMLSDSKQADRIVEYVQNHKLMEKVKGEITLKSKRISADKFKEL